MLRGNDPVLIAIIVLIAEIIIVIALSIYLAQVLPQDFGPTRPWNFPFTSVIGKITPAAVSENASRSDATLAEDLSKEDDGVRAERDLVKCKNYNDFTPLVIKDMRKVFSEKAVVKQISFCVEKGTVFGLLGPNGAGKTSLISILTGVFPPTSGRARIGGYDFLKDPVDAFKTIGVCPQFDILWDDLTVEEHLFFYSRLKGVPSELEREAAYAVEELVGLVPQRDIQVKFLSGGQKRRVSIAIALVSDPKVVFLDEPTTGLDPEVRRTVWDTIARARANRAILMVS